MSRSTESRPSTRTFARRFVGVVVALALGLAGAVGVALPASADTVFSGTVRDQSGQPVLGIPIDILTSSSSLIETIYSDPVDGSYETQSLAPGLYYFAIYDGATDSALDTYALATDDLSFGDPVRDIVVSRYVTVSGEIVNWTPEIGDVVVQLYADHGGSWSSPAWTTSTDGTFSFPSTIDSVPYTLSFDPAEINSPVLGSFLRDDGETPVFDDPEFARTIDGTAGQSLTGIETYLAAASPITGTVTTGGTTPLPGIEVWAENGSGSFTTYTETDADGRYTLYVRPGMPFVVGADDLTSTYGPMIYDGWDGCFCGPVFTPVTAPASSIDFDLRDASEPSTYVQLIGAVGDLGSDLLNEVEVRLYREDGATWEHVASMTSFDFGLVFLNFGFAIEDLGYDYRVQFVDADGVILRVLDGATSPDFITPTTLSPLPACYAEVASLSIDLLLFALVDPDTSAAACAALDAPVTPPSGGGTGTGNGKPRTSAGSAVASTPTPTPTPTPTATPTPRPTTEPAPEATDEPETAPASAPDLSWLLWVVVGLLVVLVAGGVILFFRRR